MSELSQLLKSAHVEVRERGTNVGSEFINICCPFCGEDRFHCGLHEIDLWFKCFVCGEGGAWLRIKRKLKKLHPSANWDAVSHESKSIYVPEDTKPIAQRKPVHWREITESDFLVLDWLGSSPNLKYIAEKDRERGIDIDIALDAGLLMGIGKLRGYVVFKNGNNINARKYNSDVPGPRWWKQLEDSPYLFGKEWVEKMQPKVGVISEGIFDILRVPLGQGVAILGSAVSDLLVSEIVRVFDTADSLVLALDKGANRTSVTRMRLMLLDMGFEVILPDWDSINEDGIKDLDEFYLAYGHRLGCVF